MALDHAARSTARGDARDDGADDRIRTATETIWCSTSLLSWGRPDEWALCRAITCE